MMQLNKRLYKEIDSYEDFYIEVDNYLADYDTPYVLGVSLEDIKEHESDIIAFFEYYNNREFGLAKHMLIDILYYVRHLPIYEEITDLGWLKGLIRIQG